MAQERILDIYVPEPKSSAVSNPLSAIFGGANKEEEAQKVEEPKYSAGREWCRKRLLKGELENDIIEIDVEPKAAPVIGMFAGSGMEDMSNNIQDMIGNLMPKKTQKNAKLQLLKQEKSSLKKKLKNYWIWSLLLKKLLNLQNAMVSFS